jgi:hypothetical protein
MATAKKSTKKLDQKTRTWIIVGIILGTVAVVSIVFGILALCGVFTGDDSGNGGGNGGNGTAEKQCDEGFEWVCTPLIDDGTEKTCSCVPESVALKPIIYLYPETKTDVTVRLGAPERLTASYPKYVDGWNVTAYPNGDLIDKKTGNRLYSLYWEGKRASSEVDKTVGFVVKGSDAAKFLEEKLDILGLNYKEKEEFIVYWLPKLEENAYNYIYFETGAEVDKNDMSLSLSVKPDTTIRIRMLFEGLTEKREVKEQVLTPAPARKGFTVVEWGGVDLSK